MVVGQLTYKFEELPLLQLGPRLAAALVDGEALIQYECDGDRDDWTIQRIWIEAAYLPKIGEKGRVELVELYETEPVVSGAGLFAPPFFVVRAALEHLSAEHIAEAVEKALELAEGAQ
jgi:hypothetical protein